MPKIKTRKIVAKKVRVNAKGKIRHTTCGISHNTGKKSAKRMRRVRQMRGMTEVQERAFKGMLPYLKKMG